jgi:hypothetical protein
VQTLQQLVDGLTPKEKQAILYCQRDGNGKYFYQIHSLVRKELMSLTPVPELQMIKAYRLNELGLQVRTLLEKLQPIPI